MKKIWKWLKTSNRWKHLVGGLCVGFLPMNFLCGIYCSIVAAGCLEIKDVQSGGKWDWIDFGMTAGGGLVGGCLTLLV